VNSASAPHTTRIPIVSRYLRTRCPWSSAAETGALVTD
jgi:hypothetical protein